MKNWKLRLSTAALAVCMSLGTAAPALAAGTAETAAGGASFVETLLDVPLLGSLLRLFVGDSTDQAGAATWESAATPETATPENAATPETATSETAATPTPAPTEQPTPTAAPTPDATTAPDATATPQPTAVAVAEIQWADVALQSGATLRAACREETNLGDLAADALRYAVAAESLVTTDPALNTLPLAAVVDGASLTGSVEAGTSLEAAAAALAEERIALATVTPAKLCEILNAALVDLLDAGSSRFGSFLQVSGLRFTYETVNGEIQLKQLWLCDAAGTPIKELDRTDTVTNLALALPAKLLESYGLNPAAGYTDYLAAGTLTLRGALLALPQNCDAATLAALLARGGSSGRILPVTAVNYTGMLLTDPANANLRVSALVDGKQVEAYTDGNGSLILENLTPGSHTLRMKAGEPAYYISSITHIGTPDGSAVQVLNLPADCVLGTLPTPTPAVPTAPPAATPAPTAVPVDDHGDIGPAIANGTWGQDDNAPAATQAPAPPAVTAAPQASTGNKPKATAAPIKDPTAGTILGTTPMPTLAPTPTAAPTPTPTADPDAQAKLEQAEKQSSHLPLYIGLGLLGACLVVVAVVLVKRRMDGDKRDTYRRQ